MTTEDVGMGVQSAESEKVNLEDMHWTQLKKKVEDAGGTWTNVADAIEFLNGGAVQSDDSGEDETDSADDGLIDVQEKENDIESDDDLTPDQLAERMVELKERERILDEKEAELEQKEMSSGPVRFNRNAYYTEVGGDTRAKYLQKGVYFDHAGKVVPESEAAD